MTATPTEYDDIVIGVGGMGSAAAAHLARRGRDVLGLERYDVPHAMGSSHGVTRIIRLAYYEDPSYVPLLRRAYRLWDRLEDEVDEKLLVRTGSVDASAPDDPVFRGSLRSCEEHGIEHEVLTAADLRERFPGYRLPEGHRAVYQPDGGYLLSERCIVAHVTVAQRRGAEIRARERVIDWESAGGRGRAETDRVTSTADNLVGTAGAWAAKQVDALDGLLEPERQVLGWFQPREPAAFDPGSFPVFNLQDDEGRYYGFPVVRVPGFKIGRYHHREQRVDPDDFPRTPDDADERLLRSITERHFPDAAGPTMRLSACMFTNSPDEEFILDTLPDSPNVAVGAGFSGHGFKFASVIGEVLADLAADGETEHDIGPFALDRFE